MHHVRLARPSDAAGFGETQVMAWRAAYAGVLPDEFLAALSPVESAARWAGVLAAHWPDRRLLVAEDAEGDIWGVCLVGTPREQALTGVGELQMINVHPAHWGTGTGTALIAGAEKELRRLGYSRAYLWVLEANSRARAFYERRGWELSTPESKTQSRGAVPGEAREIKYWRTISRWPVPEPVDPA